VDFGRNVALDGIDFALGPDPIGTVRQLASFGPASSPHDLRAGTPMWGDRGYVGTLYPPGTSARDALRAYGRALRTIELNATWYRTDPATIRRWAEEVPDSFTFCPKLPGVIAMEKRLVGIEAEIDAFVRAVSEFGRRLGPCWLLLPNDLGPSEFGVLERLLQRWPRHVRLAVELRHRDWFAEPVAREAVFALLRETSTAAVITDVAGRRDACHLEVTAPFTFVRLACNDLHPTDLPRARAWAERAARWLGAGLQTAWIFAHQPTEASNVPIVIEILRHFNAITGARLDVPRTHGPVQGSLF
jgi:uncharacterized protein YecE (DUF72 family)